MAICKCMKCCEKLYLRINFNEHNTGEHTRTSSTPGRKLHLCC